jgi:hypothetical protein
VAEGLPPCPTNRTGAVPGSRRNRPDGTDEAEVLPFATSLRHPDTTGQLSGAWPALEPHRSWTFSCSWSSIRMRVAVCRRVSITSKACASMSMVSPATGEALLDQRQPRVHTIYVDVAEQPVVAVAVILGTLGQLDLLVENQRRHGRHGGTEAALASLGSVDANHADALLGLRAGSSRCAVPPGGRPENLVPTAASPRTSYRLPASVNSATPPSCSRRGADHVTGLPGLGDGRRTGGGRARRGPTG